MGWDGHIRLICANVLSLWFCKTGSLGTRRRVIFRSRQNQDQLDLQTLHRSRDRLIGERTALTNQLSRLTLAVEPAELYAVAGIRVGVAANRSPRRRTAQAILASLLAKATTATL